MSQPRDGTTSRWSKVRRFLRGCLVSLLAGCQTQALPYLGDPGLPATPRAVVLGRQLIADTALEVSHRPLASSRELLLEMTDHVSACLQGTVSRRLLLPLQKPPHPLPTCPAPLDYAALEAELQRLTGKALQPAHVRLYLDGAQALAALIQAIDSATSSIDVLMFYWENDEVGEQVAQHLAVKASPTLRVRVLVDGGGNLVFARPSGLPSSEVHRVLGWLMRQPYVEVIRIRNPFARFDHRKLVLVDGSWAWTGGRNFAQNAFFQHHDLSFTVTGLLVDELQERFEDFWRQQGGTAGGRRQEAGGSRQSAVVSTEYSVLSTQYSVLSTRDCFLPTADCRLPTNNTLARLVYTDPGNPQLARTVYQAVDRARHHVYVENVYFSDTRLVCKLIEARRRGAEVRVVLTFSSSSDAINRANRVVANRLLRAGVRVYVYPVMNHVKAAAVDGCWAYLGTGNFDPLSMRHNYEMGLAVGASPLVEELETQLFLPDFRPEWELNEPLPLSALDFAAEVMASMFL
jgi:cardiolipin synthase